MTSKELLIEALWGAKRKIEDNISAILCKDPHGIDPNYYNGKLMGFRESLEVINKILAKHSEF